MKKLFLILILSFFCKASIKYSIVTDKELNKYTNSNLPIKSDSSDAAIIFLQDNHNKSYILKQIKDISLDEQFLLLNDFIASEIGYNSQIPVNKVSLIPISLQTKFKIYPSRAATLHVCVPGKDIENLPEFLPEWFTLHQRIINPNCPWQKKYPLKPERQGLKKEIIESMSLHDDLPAIVAFDIFIGNSDRSEPNIFYCQENNHFYVIDQAAAFRVNLAEVAIIRIQELIKINYFKNCSRSILKSLKIFRDNLNKLYENFSDKEIIQALEKYNSLIIAPDKDKENIVKSRLDFHKQVIQKTYISTKELINLIENLLS